MAPVRIRLLLQLQLYQKAWMRMTQKIAQKQNQLRNSWVKRFLHWIYSNPCSWNYLHIWSMAQLQVYIVVYIYIYNYIYKYWLWQQLYIYIYVYIYNTMGWIKPHIHVYIYGRRAAHHWSLPEVFRFLPRWCQTSRKWWKPSTARCPPSMTWLRLLKRRTTPHLWSATGWLLSYLYIYIWKLNDQISPPLKSQHTTVCFYGVYIYVYI